MISCSGFFPVSVHLLLCSILGRKWSSKCEMIRARMSTVLLIYELNCSTMVFITAVVGIVMMKC